MSVVRPALPVVHRSVDGDLVRSHRTVRNMGALKIWHLLVCLLFVFGVAGVIAAITVAVRRR
ncbi:hypothetical protein ACQPZX_29350 [Actinoplanes sp. CA-142083]|uniref:hypothetical protein n=1 Tax=Actinoplanes sp. CA-142083 TaxID=3239903 RepID=UPI003D901008